MTTILIDVPDEALVQFLAAENSRLRAELARRPRPSANYRDSWTPARRALQSAAQKRRWAMRKKAAATASSQIQPELNFPTPNGNGCVEHDLEFLIPIAGPTGPASHYQKRKEHANV